MSLLLETGNALVSRGTFDYAPFERSSLTSDPARIQSLKISAGLARRPWIASLTERVSDLLRLEEGWNGSSERRIHLSALSRAVAIIDAVAMPHRPWLVPIGDGRVQVEWHTHDAEVVVEVPEEGPAIVCYEDASGWNEVELDGARGLPELQRALGDLFA